MPWLPLTVELDGVLFCHASARRDDEILTRLSSPERWADALGGVESALVAAGHTHQAITVTRIFEDLAVG
jgi:hypothetical protein